MQYVMIVGIESTSLSNSSMIHTWSGLIAVIETFASINKSVHSIHAILHEEDCELFVRIRIQFADVT